VVINQPPIDQRDLSEGEATALVHDLLEQGAPQATGAADAVRYLRDLD
jgi:hypothetical protein